MRPIQIPADELTIKFSRSSGPGGQNVNKRDTRVEVIFDIGASRALSRDQKARAREVLGHRLDRDGRLHVTASAARTQSANREAAIARLHGLLEKAAAPPPPPRKRTKVSRAAKERRVEQKRRHGELKRARRRPAPDD